MAVTKMMGKLSITPDLTSSTASSRSEAQPSETFRFGDLPYDIRSLIYGLLLLSDGEIELGKMKIWAHHSRDPLSRAIPSPPMTRRAEMNRPSRYAAEARNLPLDTTIVRTCRAIYEETIPILYGQNKFVLTVDYMVQQGCKMCKVASGCKLFRPMAVSPALAHIETLHLQWTDMARLFDERWDRTTRGYDIQSVWSVVTEQCKALQTLTLTPDGRQARVIFRDIVREISHSIADVPETAAKPNLIVRTMVEIGIDDAPDSSTGSIEDSEPYELDLDAVGGVKILCRGRLEVRHFRRRERDTARKGWYVCTTSQEDLGTTTDVRWGQVITTHRYIAEMGWVKRSRTAEDANAMETED
jgi:hypothetical protein